MKPGRICDHRAILAQDGRVFQGFHSGDDRNLVLRSATCLAAKAFSAQVGIIHLDLSRQQVGLLPLSHRPQDLVVQQPGRVVFHAQMAAELKRGDASLSLADQVKDRNQVVSESLVACIIVPAAGVA